MEPKPSRSGGVPALRSPPALLVAFLGRGARETHLAQALRLLPWRSLLGSKCLFAEWGREGRSSLWQGTREVW